MNPVPPSVRAIGLDPTLGRIPCRAAGCPNPSIVDLRYGRRDHYDADGLCLAHAKDLFAELGSFLRLAPTPGLDVSKDYIAWDHAAARGENPGVPRPPGPSRNGSPRCRSGSIASGGTREYCTCDTCF